MESGRGGEKEGEREKSLGPVRSSCKLSQLHRNFHLRLSGQ